MSTATAATYGLDEGSLVTVSGPAGSLTLPGTVVSQMCDDVVWLPTNSGSSLSQALGARSGDEVTLAAAGAAAEKVEGAA